MTARKLLQLHSLIVAANARVAKMSAENETRRFKGMAPAFDAICFEPEIAALNEIALQLCEVPPPDPARKVPG